MQKRRICFIITSYIHYSRNLLILEELQKRKDIELHIILGGPALLSKYVSRIGNIRDLLREGGFVNIHDIHFSLEGSEVVTKAKSAGLGAIEFSSLYQSIKPDLVVVRGDRFEVLAAALAAAYMNIPIAHIEGGDVSGTLDESVRHAVTKLAHIHFVTNEPAKKRVLAMGENPKHVFNFGSPDVETAKVLAERTAKFDLSKTGSGAAFDAKEYNLVMFHPVTTEVEHMKKYTEELLVAIHSSRVPAIWFWPNFDAGAEEISHVLRTFRDQEPNHQIRFMRYLPPHHFIALLKDARCLIGNSSAGIKECSWFGVPVVNVGSRQANRLRAHNVIDAPHDAKKIQKAIEQQLVVGRYKPAKVYMARDTSARIAEKLATLPLYIQKKFYE